MPEPSPAVAALIRQAAGAFAAELEDVIEGVDAAVLATAPDNVAADPALVAELQSTNRANVAYWLAANVRAPGQPVAPNEAPELVQVARDIVRRGFDDAVLTSYRIGQNVAWNAWMERCFTLTDDPALLHELLAITSQSIFAFVDGTVAIVQERIAAERAAIARGTRTVRLETVRLVLERAPIAPDRASHRLGYELAGPHVAAVLFAEPGTLDAADLRAAADRVLHAIGTRRALSVEGSEWALWLWLPRAEPVDPAAVADAVGEARAAFGAPGRDVEGFRRSHAEALEVQALLMRPSAPARVASVDQLRVALLAGTDPERATAFVHAVLGDLLTAPEPLVETLRAYVREDRNAAQTARVLFTHRNTVISRIARAEELLPAPLEHRTTEVGVALELWHWLGLR
jgi:DNA-binding PucR family transcriptional regulator